MSTFASRIKEAIKHARLQKVYVKDIAEACGITPQSIYQWQKEGERVEVSGSNLVEFANITGFNARWLVNEMGPKMAHSIKTEEAMLAAIYIDQLESKQEREKIVTIINSILSVNEKINSQENPVLELESESGSIHIGKDRRKNIPQFTELSNEISELKNSLQFLIDQTKRPQEEKTG